MAPASPLVRRQRRLIARYQTGAQSFAAIVIARQQLEMVTLRLEREQELARHENESTDEYVRRIWNRRIIDGKPDPAAIMNSLSDALHARGPLLSLLRWEALQLLDPSGQRDAVLLADEWIGGAVRLILSHLKDSMLAAATRTQDARAVAVLAQGQEEARVDGRLWSVPAVWPLTFETLDNPAIAFMEKSTVDYATALTEDSLPERDAGSFLEFCILQRRVRAVALARTARNQERDFFGEDFHPETVDRLNVAASLVSELAVVLAGWSEGAPVADWLLVGGWALKAGFWLWLEDDDRSMMAARTVLEMAARLRTLRLKPHRAQSLLERDVRASNRDWFAAAGWRRMSLLQKSLGELSHPRTAPKWSSARDALAHANVDYLEEGEDPLARARGGTLTKARDVFAYEVLEYARTLSADVAEAMRSQIEAYGAVASQEDLETWLSRLFDATDLFP